jgi:hypothetical protein
MRSSASEKSKVSKWARAGVAVAALAFVPAAAAGNPVPALYNDFASDGVLSCHSKADLRAVLADATLQQYGDPSTMIVLKLASHKQLAGGCRHSAQSSSPSGSSQSSTARQRSQGTPSKKGGKNSRSERPRASAAAPPARASTVEESTDERMLLGGGLLMLTLATGGWAARRAFNGKQ